MVILRRWSWRLLQGRSSLDQGWRRLGDEPVEVRLAEPLRLVLSLIVALSESSRELKVSRGLLALGEEEVAKERVLKAVEQWRTRVGYIRWIREGIACETELVCKGNASETILTREWPKKDCRNLLTAERPSVLVGMPVWVHDSYCDRHWC
jgi:hypothetical protein